MKLRIFKGRINGPTFLVSVIIGHLYLVLLSGPINWLGNIQPWDVEGGTYALTSIILFVLILFAIVGYLLMIASLCAKRAHDLNKSAIIGLGIAIIPFGWLYMVLASGTKGRNHYGDEPRKQNYFLLPLGIEL